jgi:hypothetical protein
LGRKATKTVIRPRMRHRNHHCCMIRLNRTASDPVSLREAVLQGHPFGHASLPLRQGKIPASPVSPDDEHQRKKKAA